MADIKKIIKDLAGDFGSDNEAQMRGVQLLKGLATSDEDLANKFMKKLDKATTKISKELTEKSNVKVTLEKDLMIPGTNIILERGDMIEIIEEQMDEVDEVNDAFISSNGFKYDVTASGEYLGEFVELEEAEKTLTRWMERNSYYPTVWFIDDHGGIELYPLA